MTFIFTEFGVRMQRGVGSFDIHLPVLAARTRSTDLLQMHKSVQIPVTSVDEQIQRANELGKSFGNSEYNSRYLEECHLSIEPPPYDESRARSFRVATLDDTVRILSELDREIFFVTEDEIKKYTDRKTGMTENISENGTPMYWVKENDTERYARELVNRSLWNDESLPIVLDTKILVLGAEFRRDRMYYEVIINPQSDNPIRKEIMQYETHPSLGVPMYGGVGLSFESIMEKGSTNYILANSRLWYWQDGEGTIYWNDDESGTRGLTHSPIGFTTIPSTAKIGDHAGIDRQLNYGILLVRNVIES